MAFKTQTFEKRCLKAEWNVVVPPVGGLVESPYICVDMHQWSFKLHSREHGERYQAKVVYWDLQFEKYDKSDMPSNFQLVVHIRGKKGRNLYMTQMEISTYVTNVWTRDMISFLGSRRDVEFDENKLTFVFTLDFSIRNYTDSEYDEKEHKSVQTSPYLSCLQNLSLDFSKLMEDGSDPDVQLRCGDHVCPAHKLILGARSEVFRAMLKSDMLEGREGIVDIVDMEPQIFKIFIEYLYTGILPDLTENTASLLYQAGDKYHLETLKGRCGDFLLENLTADIACGIFAMADAHSDTDLKERVLTYIVDKEIPMNDDVWSKFYKEHPNLAFEALTWAYKKSKISK